MAHSAGRFVNKGLAKSWNRWLELLDEKARMSKFARRALNGPLARALSAWVDTVERQHHERKQMAKFGARFLRGAELKCWNQWSVCTP